MAGSKRSDEGNAPLTGFREPAEPRTGTRLLQTFHDIGISAYNLPEAGRAMDWGGDVRIFLFSCRADPKRAARRQAKRLRVKKSRTI